MNPLLLSRAYSIGAPLKRSAKTIRKEFLDYFCNEHGHTLIPSSSVAPLTDPTLAFVNSGMNQFKGIFLNQQSTALSRAANSQKCIRVGGKHNDLKIVGRDGYHHTFFEMLGNWSFGSYSKEQACQYAWELLTKSYGIEKEHLYVTYFGGDENSGLEPDLECREIWLKIGVPPERIVPFGPKENFWEMGVSGPCGPCTEIHVDLTKSGNNRAHDINQGYSDLTELWNIVFVQHERLQDGSLRNLEKQFIDTGMGFERLVALLQNQKSNYDTDLFVPLFGAIEKYYDAPKYSGKFGTDDESAIDCAYRILADHSRAITVALADGIIPEENYKLRRLIRKAINTGTNTFNKQGILSELAYRVAENLGDVYPELQSNINQVQKLIEFEELLYEELKTNLLAHYQALCLIHPALNNLSDWVLPGLINGHRRVAKLLLDLKTGSTIPGDLAYTLYDTHGIPSEVIAELAEMYDLKYDEHLFEEEYKKKRLSSKMGRGHWAAYSISFVMDALHKHKVPKTNDNLKYEYTYENNKYIFPEAKAKILGLHVKDQFVLNKSVPSYRQNGELIENVDPSEANANIVQDIKTSDIGIVLDRTSFYAQEGGQASDQGYIRIKDVVFKIHNVKKIDNYVLHYGTFSEADSTTDPACLFVENKLEVADDCTLSISTSHREALMIHHTTIHLVNELAGKVIDVLYPRTFYAGPTTLAYTCIVNTPDLPDGYIQNLEDLVNEAIQAEIPVKTKIVDSISLHNIENVKTRTNETYPFSGIRVVDINSSDVKSRELCCGTHVLNTAHLKHFNILKVEEKKNVIKIHAVAGPRAEMCNEIGRKTLAEVRDFIKTLTPEGNFDFKNLQLVVHEYFVKLSKDRYKDLTPVRYLKECYSELNEFLDTSREKAKENELTTITAEILKDNERLPSFIVYHIPTPLEHLSLHEVLQALPDMPFLLIMTYETKVKARCYIPKKLVSESFNAQEWMSTVVKVFNTECSVTEDMDPLIVAKMTSQKIKRQDLNTLVEKAVAAATDFCANRIDMPPQEQHVTSK